MHQLHLRYSLIYFTTVGLIKNDLAAGFSRTASEIAKHQVKNIPNKQLALREMRQMTLNAIDHLDKGRLEAFGKLLHQSWMIKRELSNKITTPHIDRLYNIALKEGALGGKLLGAGGGGFLLLFVEPKRQKRIREKFKKLLLVVVIRLKNTEDLEAIQIFVKFVK